MAEEKSLKLKDSGDTGRSDLLKSALKRPSTESPDRREKGTPEKKDKENLDRNDKMLSKGKEPLKSGSKDLVRSSIGKNLVKVGKEFSKGNGREQEGKVANKVGSPVVKQEARVSVKDEAKSPVKLSSKEGKVVTKEGKVVTKDERKANGKEQGKIVNKDAGKVNGKEQGKSVGKEVRKVNGKDSGGVRDLIKDEDRDREREREKGKSPVVKSALVKTPVKQGSATKVISKLTNAGASSSLGQSLKKKVMQTKTTTILKTVTEQKKEKKVFSLPGQKHDPPEDRDPLRIFYSTLRDQTPESEMAEIWLMEHGLLPQNEAKKALERKQRRGHSLKHGTPSKTSSTPSRLSNGSPGVKKSTLVSNGKGKDVGTSSKSKKKRVDSESDSDHDFVQNARMKKKFKA